METPTSVIPKEFAGVPMPTPPVQLVRTTVPGIVDKIPDLKLAISEMEIDAHLKDYLSDALDKLSTNAAEIHIHEIDLPDGGGFNLHIGVKAVQLGAPLKAAFFRGS